MGATSEDFQLAIPSTAEAAASEGLQLLWEFSADPDALEDSDADQETIPDKQVCPISRFFCSIGGIPAESWAEVIDGCHISDVFAIYTMLQKGPESLSYAAPGVQGAEPGGILQCERALRRQLSAPGARAAQEQVRGSKAAQEPVPGTRAQCRTVGPAAGPPSYLEQQLQGKRHHHIACSL